MKYLVLVLLIFETQTGWADKCTDALSSIVPVPAHIEKTKSFLNYLLNKKYIGIQTINKIVESKEPLRISDFEFININESQKLSLRSGLEATLASIKSNEEWMHVVSAVEKQRAGFLQVEQKIAEVKQQTVKLLNPKVVSKYVSKFILSEDKLNVSTYKKRDVLSISSNSSFLKLLDLATFKVDITRNQLTADFLLKLNLDEKDFIPHFDMSRSGYRAYESLQDAFITSFGGHRFQELSSMSFKDKLSENEITVSTLLDTPGVKPMVFAEFQQTPAFLILDGDKLKILDAFTLDPLRKPITLGENVIDELGAGRYFKFKGEDYLFFSSSFTHSVSSDLAKKNILVNLTRGEKTIFANKVYNISPMEHRGEMYFIGQRFTTPTAEVSYSQMEVYNLTDLKNPVFKQKIIGPEPDGHFLPINSPTIGDYVFWIDLVGTMYFMDFVSKEITFKQALDQPVPGKYYDSSSPMHYVNYKDKNAEEFILFMWESTIMKIKLTD